MVGELLGKWLMAGESVGRWVGGRWSVVLIYQFFSYRMKNSIKFKI